MIVEASLEKDSVMVMTPVTDVSYMAMAAALGAVGFTVYRLTEGKHTHLVVPLPSIDHKILGDYVRHVLESRLGVWNCSSTTWTHKGWTDIKDEPDLKLEKLT